MTVNLFGDSEFCCTNFEGSLHVT